VSASLLLGLFGHPVSQSLSPALHGAAFKYLGLDGEYRLFDVPENELKKAVTENCQAGLAGFNITLPHKIAVFKMCQTLTDKAKLVGAVNTVKVEDGGDKLIGHNTDADGLKAAIESTKEKARLGKRALLFGCGGSAQAVVVTLLELGFQEITVLARDDRKAFSFVEAANKRLAERQKDCVLSANKADGTYSLFVNSTPIGLKENDLLPEFVRNSFSLLDKDGLCVDLVYRKDGQLPLFAESAKEFGHQSIGGLSMLVHQARLAFKFWTGLEVPYEVMEEAVAFRR
jgi:shikimate dehydrogenase